MGAYAGVARALVAGALAFLTACAASAPDGGGTSQAADGQADTIRFGVGPVLPTPEETREAFRPFFAHLADALGYDDFELQETTEWAGIGVALANEQVDLAWLGPWGYVLARDANDEVQALATVEYEGDPTYRALIITREDNADVVFPDDAEGATLTLAATGSTSGWLIPTFTMQDVWELEPETYFSEFTVGGTHAANVISVVEGNVDYASDFDRHLTAMIDEGRIDEDDVAVVWQSEALPNDAIAVRGGLDVELVAEVTELLVDLSRSEARELLPDPYDGFVPADHDGYERVTEAGVAVGRIDGH